LKANKTTQQNIVTQTSISMEIATLTITRAIEEGFIQVLRTEDSIIFARTIHEREFKISVTIIGDILIVSLQETYQANLWLQTVYNFGTMFDTTTINQEGYLTSDQEDFNDEIFEIDLNNFVEGRSLLELELNALESEGR
jgi:hypothetical protein